MHPLHDLLVAAANGRFPSVDGDVEVHRPDRPDIHVVHEFTGHAVVLTDRPGGELRRRGADGFGGVAHPDVLRWLAGPAGRIGSHDVVLVARGRGAVPPTPPHLLDLAWRLGEHPRVARARHHRTAVRVHGDQRGFVTLGRGVVGRLEMSVELTGASGGDGAGRSLIGAGLDLVPAGDLVWAQVAPGNAASLRAFLAGGFVPIGAEVLIEPG